MVSTPSSMSNFPIDSFQGIPCVRDALFAKTSMCHAIKMLSFKSTFRIDRLKMFKNAIKNEADLKRTFKISKYALRGTVPNPVECRLCRIVI